MSDEQVSSYIPSDTPPATATAPPTEETNGFEHVEQTELIKEATTEETPAAPAATPAAAAQAAPAAEAKTVEGKKICAACPYSFLSGSCLSKMLTCNNLPPHVRDLVLWKCPKTTGAVFGTSFVLLVSLANCSLMTVVSSLLLLAMTVFGLYRFYLSVIFRIKGTYDETFDKASAYDLSLPKDKIQEFARLLDTDMNQSLNKLKSIVLWDNVTSSLMAFVGLYFVYCVGSIFNTMTLLILALVSAFSLPKLYQVYKVQIDQGLTCAMESAHNLARQIEAKIPPQAMQFLHKFKRD